MLWMVLATHEAGKVVFEPSFKIKTNCQILSTEAIHYKFELFDTRDCCIACDSLNWLSGVHSKDLDE